MSATIAEKDYYAILGVEPNATSDTIQQAYANLAQRYSPSNKGTGDLEKFDAVNLAYEVLSDAMMRKEFDKLKGVTADAGRPKFSGLGFFDSLGREVGLRSALLSV